MSKLNASDDARFHSPPHPNFRDGEAIGLLTRLDACGAVDTWSVLVVEDDFIIAFDLEERLADLGAAEVRIARNLDEAARHLSVSRPTLAFVDWRLGAGTAEKFVGELVKAGVKVAIVTGSSRAEMRFEDERAVVFLQKPLSDTALAAAVDTLLARA
jgi:DNA-binding NtrC family response regulator